MNRASFLDHGVLFAAAGGILGIFCELSSLVWQFYYVHLAAGMCFVAGFLTGGIYAIWKRANMKQAAIQLDSFGLKERMITAYEQLDLENELAQLQRQDALFHYQQIRERIKISTMPDKRHVLALFLAVIVVTGIGLFPSPMREQAKLRHQVQEQAGEEKEELEKFLDALEGVDMDKLTKEQRQQLKQLSESMKLSQEELAGADSWESLASAAEKLNYKYEQSAQQLQNLAAQMDAPEAAKLATAEALAKAAANQSNELLASLGNPHISAGNGSENSDENGAGGQNGDGNGGESGGGENGQGEGDGDGNGQGGGDGQGNGDGDGNGQGNGNGAGRGTGSSNATHDYVSVPNELADDPSLTGNKTGDIDSDYFRQQNGLAWEGSHVDYASVIGEYTDNAYEGIANGRYPSGMEPVIRDYFENLNK